MTTPETLEGSIAEVLACNRRWQRDIIIRNIWIVVIVTMFVTIAIHVYQRVVVQGLMPVQFSNLWFGVLTAAPIFLALNKNRLAKHLNHDVWAKTVELNRINFVEPSAVPTQKDVWLVYTHGRVGFPQLEGEVHFSRPEIKAFINLMKRHGLDVRSTNL